MHKCVISINLSLIYRISGYLHKMFKSMHMQVIVIEINAYENEISMYCYFCYMLKYALKMFVKHLNVCTL